jgi:hypothetical protein
MAITYTIVITAVRVSAQNELDNVIREVDCILTGHDGACTFELPTTVKLDPANPEEFIQFAELTEAELTTWVENHKSVVPVRAHIEMILEREVAKTALEQKSLPWESTSTESTTPLESEE